jgi:hypothetical protein
MSGRVIFAANVARMGIKGIYIRHLRDIQKERDD